LRGKSPSSLSLQSNRLETSVEMSSSLSTKASKTTEYSLSNIKFIEELGEGAFGKVYKGELIISPGNVNIPVAIKTLKEDANLKTRTDFQREARLMSELQHPNIVCLLGVCFKEEPISMLFEFMSEGDLHEYLVNHSPKNDSAIVVNEPRLVCLIILIAFNCSYFYAFRSTILDVNDFLHIAHQIAAGMEYLSAHHFVHRDLAARNCLVSNHLTVKISDFGLSRNIYSSDYYRVHSKSLLPIRWMPPESILYGKFTTESDVWAFGVLLWEIFTYGLQPYFGYNNQQVIEMIQNRQLLPCPPECPPNVYSIMTQCWDHAAKKRPTFTQLHQKLRNWKAVYANTIPSSLQSLSSKSSTFSSFNSQTNLITRSISSNYSYSNSPLINNYLVTSLAVDKPPAPSLISNYSNMNHQHIQQHFNYNRILPLQLNKQNYVTSNIVPTHTSNLSNSDTQGNGQPFQDQFDEYN